MTKLKLALGILLATGTSGLWGQNSQVLYYMNLPQNHLLNPALRPSNSLYIGLPAISGININVNNNFVNFSDIIISGETSDSLITFLHPDYDQDKFLSKIKNSNSIEPEISVQLLGLGFAFGKNNYFFLDINERIQGNGVIPGDLIALALKGNESFRGDKIDLSSLRGDIKYYHEIGMGFSKDISNRLRIGFKGKLLSGIAAASIKNRSLSIDVNEDYSHSINADVAVNFSAPLTIYKDSENRVNKITFDNNRFEENNELLRFLSGKKNVGFGFDFGATYAVTQRIMVSAALTDFGFIRWKKDLTNLRANSQFMFSGLNMTDVLSGEKTINEVRDDILDSLKNSFNIIDSNNPFTTFLPFGISMGGSYSLSDKFSIGVLSYSRFIGKQMREALTFSANVNLGNAFSTSLSYTAANHRFDNLGAGLSFRTGFFQFYILTDRIPISWNKIIIDNGKSKILLPSTWNTVNLRFGMNLVFGNRIKEKHDKPMLQNNLICKL
jgi:hypothetical protein